MRSRGKGLNSSSVLVGIAASVDDVPIPEFIRLKAEAAPLWPIYSRARARDNWREFDLILLAKICNLEADIRQHQMMLDKTGAIISSRKGTPIENPLLRVIDMLTRQQMSIIRSLSMSTPSGDPRANMAHALVAKKYKQILENDNDGLIARVN